MILIVLFLFEGVPDVAPQRSISLRDPRTSPSTLRFNWNEPDQSKCEHFNSQLDGYHYELKGTSVWNKDYVNHKTTSEHWEKFQDLMPYSGYSLNIYAKNTQYFNFIWFVKNLIFGHDCVI